MWQTGSAAVHLEGSICLASPLTLSPPAASSRPLVAKVFIYMYLFSLLTYTALVMIQT